MEELIIRVLGGVASPFERERLRRWREESPEHETAFQDLAQIWELTAPEQSSWAPERPGVEPILARAADMQSFAAEAPADPQGAPTETGPDGSGRLLGLQDGKPEPSKKEGPGSEGHRPRGMAPRRWWLLAASLAAVSLGVQLFRNWGPEPVAIYEAGPDQTMTVNLRDGSFVRLAEGARLQEWDEGTTRAVSLEGQAFFAVARDETRSFHVRTPTGQIRVLGTRFELQTGTGSLRAVVVEGRVEVSNEEGRVEVEAGEMALARPGAPPSASTPTDIYDLLDWPEGTLVFQGTALRQVADEVTRFFRRPLMVGSGPLGDRRITAWFHGESFSEVAEALCQAAGAACRPNREGGVTMEALGEEGGGS